MAPKHVFSGLFTNLKDLKSDQKDIAIHVRAIRVYHVDPYGRNVESMEVVFHDEEGTRIHCQIKKPYNRKYKKQIVEGGVYGIKNFLIYDNFQNAKTTRHEFLLAIYIHSEVKTMPKDGFPEYNYNVHSFDRVRSTPKNEDQFLLDVLGKIVGCSRVKTHATPIKEEKLIDVTIEDDEGKRMLCTLWGKHVDFFNEYIAKDLPYPSVMLLSFCRIKRFNWGVNVSTAYDVTKIVLDGDSNEIVDFRARLPNQGDESTFTNSFVSFGESVDEENLTITSIDDLLKENEEGFYWVLGEIDSLGPMCSWSYLGCTDCNRKVYPEDARFKCDGCDKTIAHGVYRYKVIVNVVDGAAGGNAVFVLFDKECSNLLGVGAHLLRESMMERKLDPDMLPNELDALVCRKAIFKVTVKKQASSPIRKGPRIFSVGQVITDPKMMSKYGERTKERTKFDDLWDNVIDLTESVEKIGSNDVQGSQSSCNKQTKEDLIDDDDPVKRELFRDTEEGEQKKLKKVKIEK